MTNTNQKYELTDAQREKLIERFKTFAANRKAFNRQKIDPKKAKAFTAKMREKLATLKVVAPAEPKKADPEKVKAFVAKMREKMAQAKDQQKASE